VVGEERASDKRRPGQGYARHVEGPDRSRKGHVPDSLEDLVVLEHELEYLGRVLHRGTYIGGQDHVVTEGDSLPRHDRPCRCGAGREVDLGQQHLRLVEVYLYASGLQIGHRWQGVVAGPEDIYAMINKHLREGECPEVKGRPEDSGAGME